MFTIRVVPWGFLSSLATAFAASTIALPPVHLFISLLSQASLPRLECVFLNACKSLHPLGEMIVAALPHPLLPLTRLRILSLGGRRLRRFSALQLRRGGRLALLRRSRGERGGRGGADGGKLGLRVPRVGGGGVRRRGNGGGRGITTW